MREFRRRSFRRRVSCVQAQQNALSWRGGRGRNRARVSNKTRGGFPLRASVHAAPCARPLSPCILQQAFANFDVRRLKVFRGGFFLGRGLAGTRRCGPIRAASCEVRCRRAGGHGTPGRPDRGGQVKNSETVEWVAGARFGGEGECGR